MTIAEKDQQGFDQSLWSKTAQPAADCPTLTQDGTADVLVIGGGFAGLSASLHLAERGVSVTVLEAKEPGWGASGRNGGQVISGLKHDFAELQRMFGTALAERMIGFADAASDNAFALIKRHGIDCDAVQGGWIQGAHSTDVLPELHAKAERLQARGIDVSVLSAAETAEKTGTDWYHGSYFDPRGGTVQPLSFARGLARAAMAAGVRLYQQSPVTALTRKADQWQATTRQGATVTAPRVLLCTNGYSNMTDPVSKVTRSVVPFYSYQIATEPLSDNLLRSLPAQGLGVSETRRVLSYSRIDAHGRFLMGARGALDGSITDSAFDLARSRLKQLFPRLADVPLDSFWNGRVAVTPDHLPRLAEVEPGLHAALGWNGRGVAMTTAIGPVLADWMTGAGQADLPMPITGPRPIPFHWLHRPASGLAVAWKNFQDRRERAAG